MAHPRAVIRAMWKGGRRVAVTAVGSALVVLGVVLFVLPGPGLVVLALGFAVLATEYAWAQRALDRSRDAAGKATVAARQRATRAARSVRGTSRRN